MADWDEDSERLRQNLTRVLETLRDAAIRRDPPSLAAMRQAHTEMMAGLTVPRPEWVGRFRGEQGALGIGVRIGGVMAVASADVAGQLAQFEATLQRAAGALDSLYPADQDLDADGFAAAIDLAGWAHSEWVRIHPFANGNGRAARLGANALLMRYGLPPVVRLRPRPGDGYAQACIEAMRGEWRATAAWVRSIVSRELAELREADPA